MEIKHQSCVIPFSEEIQSIIALIVLNCVCCFVLHLWSRKEMLWSNSPSFFTQDSLEWRMKKAK